MSGTTAQIAHRTATATNPMSDEWRYSAIAHRTATASDAVIGPTSYSACSRQRLLSHASVTSSRADVDTVDAETGQRDEPLEHAVAGVDGAQQLPLDRGRGAPDIPASSSRNRSRSGPLSATVMLAVVEKASWLPASSAERRARSMGGEVLLVVDVVLVEDRPAVVHHLEQVDAVRHAPPPGAAAAAARRPSRPARGVSDPTRCRTPPDRSDRRRTPCPAVRASPGRSWPLPRAAPRSAGGPSARPIASCSGRYQPVPRPSSARPPEIRSMVATAWAHSAG